MDNINRIRNLHSILDSYVMHITQVATLLGYGEPQVLEVFKTHFQQNYIEYYSL